MNSLYTIAALSRPMSAAVFTPLWDYLLRTFPALSFEYIQVLVFIVVPSIVFLAIVVVNLTLHRGVLQEPGRIIFRPSMAMRTAYVFVLSMVLGNLFIANHQNWFLVVTNLLAAFEIARTFPRTLTISASGIEWRALLRRVNLPWENISAFVPFPSGFGTHYELFGNEDQYFLISSLENPNWRKAIQTISRNLVERHLNPNLSRPHNFLESLHRVLLPASLLITFAGPHLPHF